jgi:hypothetical protein
LRFATSSGPCPMPSLSGSCSIPWGSEFAKPPSLELRLPAFLPATLTLAGLLFRWFVIATCLAPEPAPLHPKWTLALSFLRLPRETLHEKTCLLSLPHPFWADER